MDNSNKCSICKNGELVNLTSLSQSEQVCLNCGAIFYSKNHPNPKLAGEFTGEYIALSKEQLYKLSEKRG